jgi:hypothetical protein
MIDRPVPSPTSTLTEFYREEFVKHQRCLEEQREYFSPQAIHSVESALVKVISQVDALSTKADADQVVAKLLREFDLVTRLSAWSDPNKAH